MVGEPDPAGHPQRGSSGGWVLCSANVMALACRAAYRDVHQVLEHYGISFRKGLNSGVQLELYMDADYAHEANERRSVSGGVVMCAGACVSCRFTVAHRKSSRCVLRKRTTWRRPREFARRVHAVCLESHFSRSRCWMYQGDG